MHYLHAEAPVKVIHRDLKSRNGSLLESRNNMSVSEHPYLLPLFCPAVVMTADRVLKVRFDSEA